MSNGDGRSSTKSSRFSDVQRWMIMKKGKQTKKRTRMLGEGDGFRGDEAQPW